MMACWPSPVMAIQPKGRTGGQPCGRLGKRYYTLPSRSRVANSDAGKDTVLLQALVWSSHAGLAMDVSATPSKTLSIMARHASAAPRPSVVALSPSRTILSVGSFMASIAAHAAWMGILCGFTSLFDVPGRWPSITFRIASDTRNAISVSGSRRTLTRKPATLIPPRRAVWLPSNRHVGPHRI